MEFIGSTSKDADQSSEKQYHKSVDAKLHASEIVKEKTKIPSNTSQGTNRNNFRSQNDGTSVE